MSTFSLLFIFILKWNKALTLDRSRERANKRMKRKCIPECEMLNVWNDDAIWNF
jgi:hypothetical protein